MASRTNENTGEALFRCLNYSDAISGIPDTRARRLPEKATGMLWASIYDALRVRTLFSAKSKPRGLHASSFVMYMSATLRAATAYTENNLAARAKQPT